jgi:hypothetical protein
VVQGNALKLHKYLEKVGAVIVGESEALQALFVRFPGRVRMEIGSTLTMTFPKPGKAVVKPANILDDLRRRDFTANAMALSLNEGSYGLLMDPLNGVADIENRELRLVSNYGFIEDPVRMVRAARLAARLGWQMEEKTRARYETGKSEGYISAMTAWQRGYETEEIAHEEDPLRVLRGLEHEGWMKHLASGWTSAKANSAELEKLREAQMQLQLRGITADASAVHFPLLTAKMQSNDLKALKKSFPRQGFVKEIDALEGEAKKFAAELSGKGAATPSAAWKMLMNARPEVVLWVAYSTKNGPLQAKFKNFYTEWPQARQKIPYTLMQEMRIIPSLPGFDELVEKIFFELMDGKLATEEQMKAYLEPYSPPAPPPPVHLRRARATKKEAKVPKARKKADASQPEGEGLTEAAKADGLPGAVAAKPAAQKGKAVEAKPVETKAGAAAKTPVPAKHAVPEKAATLAKKASKPVAAKVAAKASAKPVAAKKAPMAKPAKKAVPAKTKAAAKPTAKKAAAKKASVKAAVKKVAVKTHAKVVAKPAAKAQPKPAKKPASKGAAKKKK